MHELMFDYFLHQEVLNEDLNELKIIIHKIQLNSLILHVKIGDSIN
jgi:hypothetical protein